MVEKIIRELLFSARMDMSTIRGKIFLFLFNIMPDLYSLKILSNILLRLGGCRVSVFKTYIRKRLSIDTPENTQFGSGGFVNKGLLIEGSGRVTIGDRFQIGPNTNILTTNHLDHSVDQIMDVVIGDDVWIGAGVIITPGSTICNNVSIAAGSVVVSDITESGLWGGVPARKIK